MAVWKVSDGWSQKDVANFLGVHPVYFGRWVRAYRAAGDGGLATKPTPDRPSFVTPRQEAQVLRWLADKLTDQGSGRTYEPPGGSPR